MMVCKPSAMAASRPGACGLPPDAARLELAEGVLDGREVRRIRWQEADLTACRFNAAGGAPRCLCTLRLSQMHDLSGTQRGEQDLTHEQVPDLTIGRPAHRHRCGDAGGAHRRDEGDIGAVVARDAARPPAVRVERGRSAASDADSSRSHRQRPACAGSKLGRLSPPRGPLRLIPLTSAQNFF